MPIDNPSPCLCDSGNDRDKVIQPNHFMHILAEAIQDELAFFSQDLHGKITYLSKSAEVVLRLTPNQVLNRPASELLSNNPCNDAFRNCKWIPSLSPVAETGICEFSSDENNTPFALKYWRIQVSHQGSPIGFSGILLKLDCNSNAIDFGRLIDVKNLMGRVESLTPVEFQVIDMVVDGHMNKESAALLSVAVRTIESRRSRAMLKLKANGLSDLVQIWVHARQHLASDTYSHIAAKFEKLPDSQ